MMDILRLFLDKSHYIEFCHEENQKNQFVQEALKVWDSMEGTLPHIDVFVEAFVNARRKSWEESTRWN